MSNRENKNRAIARFDEGYTNQGVMYGAYQLIAIIFATRFSQFDTNSLPATITFCIGFIVFFWLSFRILRKEPREFEIYPEELNVTSRYQNTQLPLNECISIEVYSENQEGRRNVWIEIRFKDRIFQIDSCRRGKAFTHKLAELTNIRVLNVERLA
ncbi:MAG: hypothetical protein KDC26_09230 [Armatimonadetes bacterium]|nr:hypothetical protein [Armatimonadota bacterium]